MRAVCENLHGVSYGRNGLKCAVSGNYIELSSRLPSDKTWKDMESACKQLGGTSYANGVKCAVKGPWTELEGHGGSSASVSAFDWGWLLRKLAEILLCLATFSAGACLCIRMR